MDETEKTYTLAEAEHILRRKDCAENGHDLEEDLTMTFGGKRVNPHPYCTRCHATFKEVQ